LTRNEGSTTPKNLHTGSLLKQWTKEALFTAQTSNSSVKVSLTTPAQHFQQPSVLQLTITGRLDILCMRLRYTVNGQHVVHETTTSVNQINQITMMYNDPFQNVLI
jgi:hypothetical protein